MESDEKKGKDTVEAENWKRTYRLPAFDNILPVVKSMITLIEGEKNKTLDKIEETKKLLENLKQRK